MELNNEKEENSCTPKTQCSDSVHLESFLFLFFSKAQHKRRAGHRCFSTKTFCSAQAKVIIEPKRFCWVMNEPKISLPVFNSAHNRLSHKVLKFWFYSVYQPVAVSMCACVSVRGWRFYRCNWKLCFTIFNQSFLLPRTEKPTLCAVSDLQHVVLLTLAN